MSDVRRCYTDLTRLPSPVYKQIDPKQGAYARAVLKENAKFMLVMEDGTENAQVKRAYSARPGKCRGVRPMHMSTLSLDHDSPASHATYSRHFSSKPTLKPIKRPDNYPSQFSSQIILEHDLVGSINNSTDTTSKSTFQYWDSAAVRSSSRENNKENMRCGTKGAEVVFEKLEPSMYTSTYQNNFAKRKR